MKRVNLTRLRNEEYFTFFAEFKAFVEEISPGTLNIVELYAVFVVLYLDLDTALEKIRKSAYTEPIVLLGEQRNDVFRGLTISAQAPLHHFNPVLRAAAENLKLLFDHYGNIATRPYNEETGALINFIEELRDAYAEPVKTLGLSEWVDELERLNNEFKEFVLKRNRDNAEKPNLHVSDLRRKINRCYLDIIERIEAQILLQGEETFATFVKLLNTNIDRYTTLINRRKGKKDSNEQTDFD
jgi:hypothetical protein